MRSGAKRKAYTVKGTDASWYSGWDLTDAERDRFRQTSLASQAAKALALKGECNLPKHPIPVPNLNPADLMPVLPTNGLTSLSLFSGGGGLDIGFVRAGFSHVASYDILPDTGPVLKAAYPDWKVFSGDEGDVTSVDWEAYRGRVDVLHGGPPCQPFSHAGKRNGKNDVRDMIPEFVRAVLGAQPKAFVCENVSGLATKKFSAYIEEAILQPLKDYRIYQFALNAADFGVPQRRRRIFFVGFSEDYRNSKFQPPMPTHAFDAPLSGLPKTMGAREALGLPDIGFDGLAPTLRSGLTGPRHTTSVLNSVTAQRDWEALQIWPNGVAETREKAAQFVAKNGAFRLSIADCMILQGFPADWPIRPPVYRALGLIGNSVAPPMGYAVAAAVAKALLSS